MKRIGSIVHGAYGDYFEQLLCLKHYKQLDSAFTLVVFFASESRLRELQVFDLSFIDEIHLADSINDVYVDEFIQYQVKDQELIEGVLSKARPDVLSKIGCDINLKPWKTLRSIDFSDQRNDIGLSSEGKSRLKDCFIHNEIPEDLFSRRKTIGFLWRHRGPKGAISPVMQVSEQGARISAEEILSGFIERENAYAIISGIGVQKTESNKNRIDAKYSPVPLDVDPENSTHMKGFNWGLELEIMSRCDVCIVMASGFSEALWVKRQGGRGMVLINTPPHYLLKAVYNRMPLFDLNTVPGVLFQLRQPQSFARVSRFIAGKDRR
jgi:hypothetical protein